MLALALIVTPLLFAFLVIYGGLSDLSTFRIPNIVPYGLVVLFLAHSLLVWMAGRSVPPAGLPLPQFAADTGIGLFVLIVSMLFWRRGDIGGGDVKYLAACSLFMGTAGIVPFLVLLSGFALFMALALKLSSGWGFLIKAGRLPVFVKQLYAKLEVNQLPYGFPIGLAALVMIPEAFRL